MAYLIKELSFPINSIDSNIIDKDQAYVEIDGMLYPLFNEEHDE